jgi:hypothetical protein
MKGELMFQVTEGGVYDSLTCTYQTIELARLNDVLKEAGLEDVSLRRKICENYFFNSGYFSDSCWFKEGGSRYRPLTCFADFCDQRQEQGRIFIPDPRIGTMFHEYALGAADWVFDRHNENVSEIETGDVWH